MIHRINSQNLAIIIPLAFALLLQSCGMAKTYQKIPGQGIENDARIIYEYEFVNNEKTASGVLLTYCRTPSEGDFFQFILRGNLSRISASVLFPEDVWIAQSRVQFRYLDNGIWHEKHRERPPKLPRVLDEEFAPASLPKHIPYGIGIGYRFLGKMLKKTLDAPYLDDNLENNFDAVDVAFTERKGVKIFCIHIPIEHLDPKRVYDIRFIAQYHDGQPRYLDDKVDFQAPQK